MPVFELPPHWPRSLLDNELSILNTFKRFQFTLTWLFFFFFFSQVSQSLKFNSKYKITLINSLGLSGSLTTYDTLRWPISIKQSHTGSQMISISHRNSPSFTNQHIRVRGDRHRTLGISQDLAHRRILSDSLLAYKICDRACKTSLRDSSTKPSWYIRIWIQQTSSTKTRHGWFARTTKSYSPTFT